MRNLTEEGGPWQARGRPRQALGQSSAYEGDRGRRHAHSAAGRGEPRARLGRPREARQRIDQRAQGRGRTGPDLPASQGGCRTSRPRDRAQRAPHADGAVTVVTGEAARGTVAAEVARQEGAFLGRQSYRLERARDTLVRELAKGRSHEGQRSVRMQAPAFPSANPHPRVFAEELEAMLERKLKLRLMRVCAPLKRLKKESTVSATRRRNPSLGRAWSRCPKSSRS